MPLLTTAIGAYPKPDYIATADWFSFETTTGPEATLSYSADGRDSVSVLDQAVREVVRTQVGLGIDIPTDGEIRRENYVHYHCRHLTGIDFDSLTSRQMRNGAWQGEVPTVVNHIRPGPAFLDRDWRVAQEVTERPVKMTMPGPMTIMDSVADSYYTDDRRFGADIAAALNSEAHALAASGCSIIQVDEPVFARYPEHALAEGIDLLETVFDGLDDTVTRAMHMCCGYPDRLDSTDYAKADPGAYRSLARALDSSTIGVVSIEDAHRPNDLSLFESFEATTVVLGAVASASSRLESPEEIAARATAVLGHIDASRLMLSPDCGLGLLGRQMADAKLANLVAAARSLP